MGLVYNGSDVGRYTTSTSWGNWWDDARGGGNGSRFLIQNEGTHTAYIFLAENTSFGVGEQGRYGIGANFYDEDGDTEDAQIKTTWVDLAGKVFSTGIVFEQGQGLTVGSHGQHDFVYAEGEPVRDDGDSSIVFEEGTGMGFTNTQTLIEDDSEEFGGTFTDDKYDIDGQDAVAQHYYEQEAGDGVVWAVSEGTYTIEIEASDITDGRPTSPPNPEVWYVVGPNGAVDAGSTGSPLEVTIDL